MTKYFVTGGSGFIGSSVVRQLKESGHDVLALARSDSSAAKLEALGAEVLRGDITDVEILKKGAKAVDGGVIYLAFIHDFSRFAESIVIDRSALESIAEVLEGTGKLFISTSGNLSLGHPVGTPDPDERYQFTEDFLKSGLGARIRNELFVLSLKQKGIRSSVIRLPPIVHGDTAAGFGIYYLSFSLKSNTLGYIGDGNQGWTAVHRDDAAAAYVLAAEKGISGHVYHPVGETITIKELAQEFQNKYGLAVKQITPETAAEQYSFLSHYIGVNATVSSTLTKKELGWEPKGNTLSEDIAQYDYKQIIEANIN